MNTARAAETEQFVIHRVKALPEIREFFSVLSIIFYGVFCENKIQMVTFCSIEIIYDSDFSLFSNLVTKND